MTKTTKRSPRATPKKVKPKFQAEREEAVKVSALKPFNDVQLDYMRLLDDNSKQIVVATGYPGTSKTYLATCMAADKFRVGDLKRIIFTRPAVSSSKSLGMFPGTATEKLSVWLQPVLSILKERIGEGALEIALKNEDITLMPLEVVKGLSLENEWLIVEEASDLTKEEVIKLITRVGKGSKVILAGDLAQSELKEKAGSGLKWFKEFIEKNNMQDIVGHVDFDDPSHIVRSATVKRLIIALYKEGCYHI